MCQMVLIKNESCWIYSLIFPFLFQFIRKQFFSFQLSKKQKILTAADKMRRWIFFAKFSRISILINYAHISLETSEKLLQDRKDTSFKSVTTKWIQRLKLAFIELECNL